MKVAMLLLLLLPSMLAGLGVYVALGPVTFWERLAAGVFSIIVGFLVGIGWVIIVASRK